MENHPQDRQFFSTIERKTFLNILKENSIVENKNTDGASLREKNEAWKKITAYYNASPHSTRMVTEKQLRRLWANLKQRQRSALARERQHRWATGGGPPVVDAVIDADVTQVAPALIVGIEDVIDSDTPNAEIVIETTNDPTNFVQTSLLPPNAQKPMLNKSEIIYQEHLAREERAKEIHLLEKKLLLEKIREAKAKADLAESILNRKNY